MRRTFGAGVCLLTMACGMAHSQDLSGLTGTIRIKADTVFRQGQIDGCSLNYQAAVQDYTYRNGALVGVSGSFNLTLMRRGTAKTVGGLLKVGVKQIAPPATGVPEAPAFAYLASQNGSTARNVVADNVSGTPGYRLLVLKADKELLGLIGDMLDGSPVTLYYSRTSTGIDVKVPLDLRVIDSNVGPSGFEPVRSDATVASFGECFQRLAQELK